MFKSQTNFSLKIHALAMASIRLYKTCKKIIKDAALECEIKKNKKALFKCEMCCL